MSGLVNFTLDPLSTTSPIPLHYQIREQISRAIQNGRLTPNDLLPSEEELARQSKVSRTTVRQALAALVHDGLIERKRGRGTRVLEPRIDQGLAGIALTSFVGDVHSRGLESEAKVLSVEIVPADVVVSEALRVVEDLEVIRIERVRLGDGRPILLDVSYIPLEIGKKVANKDLRTRGILDILEQDFGVVLTEANYRIQAVAADKHNATQLAIRPGAPLLKIERNTYSLDGFPISYENLYYRADRMTLSVRLSRRQTRSVSVVWPGSGEQLERDAEEEPPQSFD